MSQYDYNNTNLSENDLTPATADGISGAEWTAEPDGEATLGYTAAADYTDANFASEASSAAPVANDTPMAEATPLSDPAPSGFDPYDRAQGYTGPELEPEPAAKPHASGPRLVVPETPEKKPKTRAKLGFGRTLLILLLALAAGFLGSLLQTKLITAKVSDEITSDIAAYLEEAGGTVLYRSVETEGETRPDTGIDVSEVAELATDSVVEIATEIVTNDFYSWFYSGSNVQEGAGSGVILSEDGYILTCFHVIEDASSITVATHDGQTYEATLIGGDKEEDIAIIKIEAEGLHPAVLGDSRQLVVGSPVVAIGNPLGQLGGTVTSGIVSALEREITIEDQTFTVIQTDAAINGGNSGGGLFNNQGELIGLVNAKASSIGVEGLGFAIPIDAISDFIEDIIANGYITSKVTLGVTLLNITDERTALSYRVKELGVYILYVQDNSNAAYAGLQSGDRIVSVDGQKIESDDQVVDIIGTKSAGDVLEMDIERGGEKQHLSITLYGAVPSTDGSGSSGAQQTGFRG